MIKNDSNITSDPAGHWSRFSFVFLALDRTRTFSNRTKFSTKTSRKKYKKQKMRRSKQFSLA